MSEWKEVKLKELGRVVTGTTPSSKFPDEFGSEMPFVTPSDYKNYNKWISSAERYLSDKGITKLQSRVLPKKSLLVTCIGSNMGKVAINKIPVVSNQQINSIVPNENIDADFLYYKLIDSYDVLRMYGEAGTAVPIVNKGEFENIEIVIPENKSEQRSIAEVLSSLDDKIDLLHRQNKTLEQLAETLFRQWFVEEADESWEVGTLGEVISIYDSKRIPLSSGEREKMKVGQLYPYYGAASIMDYVNDYIFDGEYILMGEDGTVQTPDGFPILQLATGKFWVNNHAHIFEAKPPFTNFFIYTFLKQTNISGIVTGAVQPKINQEALKNIEFPIPPIEKTNEFITVTNEFWNRIKSNTQQIRTLTQLRDTLLPKLMSGEIRLNGDFCD